jgi:hypothetical protein
MKSCKGLILLSIIFVAQSVRFPNYKYSDPKLKGKSFCNETKCTTSFTDRKCTTNYPAFDSPGAKEYAYEYVFDANILGALQRPCGASKVCTPVELLASSLTQDLLCIHTQAQDYRVLDLVHEKLYYRQLNRISAIEALKKGEFLVAENVYDKVPILITETRPDGWAGIDPEGRPSFIYDIDTEFKLRIRYAPKA